MSRINLERLYHLTKRKEAKVIMYLNEFLAELHGASADLEQAIQSEDRLKIRDTAHHVGPQLIFFKVSDSEKLIQNIEQQYQKVQMEDLLAWGNHLHDILKESKIEVREILQARTY